MAILRYNSTHTCPHCAGKVNLGAMLKAKPKQLLARKKFLALIEKQTPILAAKINIWMSKEAKRIASEVSSQMTANKVHLGALLGKAKKPKTVDEIIDELDLSGWDALAGIITADTFAIFRQAYEEGLQVAGVTDVQSTDQMDEAALQFARERGAELVGKQIDEDGNIVDNPDPQWSISESTRDRLRTTIADSVENGDSTDELSDRIESSYAFSDTRSTTIARTELANAHVQGNIEGWKGSGAVSMKQSVLGSEHDVDDDCDSAAEDGPIPLDDEFSNGMMAPPYHPNCVCDLLPVVDEDSKDDSDDEDAEKFAKGDTAGHEFHGNQWTGGGAKAGAKVARQVKGSLTTDMVGERDINGGAMHVPFPEASHEQYALAMDQYVKAGGSSKTEPTTTKSQTIALCDVIATQPAVNKDKVVEHAKSKDTKPILVSKVGDKYVALDGHHTMTAARLSGATHIQANVVDAGNKKSTQTTSLTKLVTDDQANEATGHTASQAQIEAGNYKKGHLQIGKLNISIENPAGSHRRPEWPELKHHYGYIRGTVGADGDHVDCFVRCGISKDYDNTVWVINQVKEDGSFDEHKCLIGWPAEHDAKDAYMENYSSDWKGLGSVVGLPFADFEAWIKNGDHTKPLKGD